METQGQNHRETIVSPEVTKRERLSMVATGAVLRWMDALTRHTPEFRRPAALTRSRELGAAFVASTLFTAVTGCSNFETVDCSAEDQEFMQSVVYWISDHPAEIQQQMDLLWPDSTITAQQLIDTLLVSRIQCGVQGPDAETDLIAGEAHLNSNVIVVDINEKYYDVALDEYTRTSWVEGYSEDELIEIASFGDEEIIYPALCYFSSITILSGLLAHEASHIATHERHDNDDEEILMEEVESGINIYEEEPIDQVYAWGFSAMGAVKEYEDELQLKLIDAINK